MSLKTPSHLNCVAPLSCEMSSVLKATIENKMISVTFYKINNRKKTCLFSQILSTVTVTSCTLWCGEIFSDNIITNFLLDLTVK